MKVQKTTSTILLLATAGMHFATAGNWLLLDDFQQFYDGQIFTEATEIGWHASNPTGVTTYRMLTDPEDLENIALFVKYGLYGVGFNTPVLMQKALPNGGIAPGETGTLFFRSYWEGFGSAWLAGTADQELEFDDLTGFQIVPGAWSDFNAQIRIGLENTLDHRDGDAYVSTNPPQIVESGGWYSFWLVVENTWDMGTTPATSMGVYTLYAQGPGIGDGVNPALIPVGTDPPKNKASLRRAPVDASGNPQSIIWAQFATSSEMVSLSESLLFLVDDFYYSSGENLSRPDLTIEPALAAPSELVATHLSDSEIQLAWEDNTSGVAGFRIYMETGEGTWQELADVASAGATGHTVTNPTPGQPVRIRIRAYTEDRVSRYSRIAIASWGNPILEGATLGSSSWWELDWFGQYVEMGRAWVYHDELGLLYLSGENAGSFYAHSVLLDTWFWTSRDMFPYFYKYGAYEGWYFYYAGSANEDRWFARLSDGTYVRAPHINQAVSPPSAPSNLKARIYSSSSVYLSWDDNADREVGFRIFMQTGEDGPWSEVVTAKVKDLTQFIVNGIDTETPHRFKVQAYKFGSNSDFSNTAQTEWTDVRPHGWMLMDDFQQHIFEEMFASATEIGWHAFSPEENDDYWFLNNPFDPTDIGLVVATGNLGVEYGSVWLQKALPFGGIAPGETGTLYFRVLWTGLEINWAMGTADKQLEFDPVTGLQSAPGALGDFNALFRLGNAQNIEHRDGDQYVATNPAQQVETYHWYHFWLVVENRWDMGTTPATSAGVYTLYAQGPGIGNGVNPTLIPVGTNPHKDKAFFLRAPVDSDGNPQSIIWAQFYTDSGFPCSSCYSPFLLDDFFFSLGENLTMPGVMY